MATRIARHQLPACLYHYLPPVCAWRRSGRGDLNVGSLPRLSVFFAARRTSASGRYFRLTVRFEDRKCRRCQEPRDCGHSRTSTSGQELTSRKSRSAGQDRGCVSPGQTIAGAAVTCSMRLVEPGRGANAQACRNAGRGAPPSRPVISGLCSAFNGLLPTNRAREFPQSRPTPCAMTAP